MSFLRNELVFHLLMIFWLFWLLWLFWLHRLFELFWQFWPFWQFQSLESDFVGPLEQPIMVILIFYDNQNLVMLAILKCQL